jgi:hypothetical protein
MIRNGIPTTDIETYLLQRAWLQDAARLLRTPPDALADELTTTMINRGAIEQRGGRLLAAAEHTPVVQATLNVPFPTAWSDPVHTAHDHDADYADEPQP